MNKLILFFLSTTTFLTFGADTDTLLQNFSNLDQFKYAQSVRTDRIQVLPISKIDIPDKEKIVQDYETQEKNGYFESTDVLPKKLIKMGNEAPNKKRSSLADTSLQDKLVNIPLAFHFEFTPTETESVIGYAPAIKMIDTGWTGIEVFFEDNILGVCEFATDNIALSHGEAKIAEELARYDVNDKVTTVAVFGSEKTKFLYRVDWFDNNYIRSLECAKDKYDSKQVGRMIDWAKEHDS